MIGSKHGSARTLAAVACLTIAVLMTGCQWRQSYYQPEPPAPLGALSDPIWQNQEANAEASNFVMYEHEFQRDAEWLNLGGEDHVKQIAARLQAGQDALVVVERSMTSPLADTQHHYPVHPNPELDLRRREIVVRCLAAMGTADADQRVVVAPAFAPGITGNEAEAAYRQGLGGAGFDVTGGFGGFMYTGGF